MLHTVLHTFKTLSLCFLLFLPKRSYQQLYITSSYFISFWKPNFQGVFLHRPSYKNYISQGFVFQSVPEVRECLMKLLFFALLKVLRQVSFSERYSELMFHNVSDTGDDLFPGVNAVFETC